MSNRSSPGSSSLWSPPWSLDVVWLVLPATLAAVAFGLLPMRSWDGWWHLYIGRHVSRTGDVPATNGLLYTLPNDTASFVQPWLAQQALHELHRLGGLSALLTVRSLATVVVFGAITWMASRRARSIRTGSLLALVGLAMVAPYVSVRTHLLVWPLYVVLFATGLAIRAGRLGLAWGLVYPAAAALWVQMHGSFPLVVLLCLVFACAAAIESFTDANGSTGGREAIIWLLYGGLSAGATGLHPRGFDVWTYVVSLGRDPAVRQLVTEWWPASPTNPTVLGGCFYVAAALALGWGGYRAYERETSAFEWSAWLMLGATTVMAALRARGLLWFGLTCPIAVAHWVPSSPSQIERPVEKGTLASAVHGLCATACCGSIVLLLPVHPMQADIAAACQAVPIRRAPPGRGRLRAETPVDAVERLNRLDAPHPRIFHDQKYAGYLLWRLDPPFGHRIVFVDQRIELPPLSLWKQYAAIERGRGWRRAFERWNVEAALVGSRQNGLASSLTSSKWRRAVDTPRYTLFLAPGRVGARPRAPRTP